MIFQVCVVGLSAPGLNMFLVSLVSFLLLGFVLMHVIVAHAPLFALGPRCAIKCSLIEVCRASLNSFQPQPPHVDHVPARMLDLQRDPLCLYLSLSLFGLQSLPPKSVSKELPPLPPPPPPPLPPPRPSPPSSSSASSCSSFCPSSSNEGEVWGGEPPPNVGGVQGTEGSSANFLAGASVAHSL